jgi:hypothetical protein
LRSGRLLTYVYTKAANRGRADIAIDGVHRATLDLYSRKAEWQSRTAFKVDPGQHLAVITILPDKNPKSSDRFIDVDAFGGAIAACARISWARTGVMR